MVGLLTQSQDSRGSRPQRHATPDRQPARLAVRGRGRVHAHPGDRPRRRDHQLRIRHRHGRLRRAQLGPSANAAEGLHRANRLRRRHVGREHVPHPVFRRDDDLPERGHRGRPADIDRCVARTMGARGSAARARGVWPPAWSVVSASMTDGSSQIRTRARPRSGPLPPRRWGSRRYSRSAFPWPPLPRRCRHRLTARAARNP